MAGRISYYGGIVKDGLILDLDAGKIASYVSGSTTWNDISTKGFNASLVNGPKYSLDRVTNVQFDGIDDFGSISYTLQNQYTNKLSINVWVKPLWFDSGNSDGVNIIGKAMPSLTSPYTIWSFSLTPTGNYGTTMGDGSSRVICTSTSQITLNTWVNLCVTYDGATIRLYKNGVQDATTAACTYTLGQNTVPITIASWQTLGSFNDWFKGYIGVIQLYNRGLTSAEVLQNYNATKGRYL